MAVAYSSGFEPGVNGELDPGLSPLVNVILAALNLITLDDGAISRFEQLVIIGGSRPEQSLDFSQGKKKGIMFMQMHVEYLNVGDATTLKPIGTNAKILRPQREISKQ